MRFNFYPGTHPVQLPQIVFKFKRVEKLNFIFLLPGSTCGKISLEESLDRIGESVNQALKKTKGVTVCKEICCFMLLLQEYYVEISITPCNKDQFLIVNRSITCKASN